MFSKRAAGSGPLPIVPCGTNHLTAAEQERLQNLARELLRDEPALAATEAFGPHVKTGLGPGPTLFYEDHSVIPLVREWVTESYKYRIALLAGDGDMLAIGAPRNPEYEGYLSNVLGLGRPEVITVHVDDGVANAPLAKRLLQDDAALATIADRARRAGGLNILPYIGQGGAWRLAAQIADLSGVPVHVAAPPPRLERRVNDKLWFSQQVTALLGRQALPVSQSVFGPAALAARLKHLARRHDQVVIKVPDSAGAIGNIVLASEILRGLDTAGARDLLLGFLHAIGWHQTFPLLVSVWEGPVLMSPSVQVWIGDRTSGPPVIEGMFMQMITGGKGRFYGARQGDFSAPWGEQLAHEAVMLATLLQDLGYFGRCSFDALIVRPPERHDALVHWVECNGRWGAVSIPLTLANRLTGARAHPPHIAVQHYVAAEMDLTAILQRLDDHLFRPGAQSGVVLLTPGGRTRNGGFDFMVIDRDPESVTRQIEAVTQLLDQGANTAP